VNVYELDSNRIPVAPDGPLALTASYQSVEDADTVDIDHARVSFLYEPSDTFWALLSYQTQSDNVGGRRQQTPGLDGFGNQYNDYENGSIQLEPSSRDIDLTSLEMEFDLGFATLTSSTSSYDQSGESISENTGFYAQLNWLANFYYNYPRPMAEAARTYSDTGFIQEVRLVSNGDNDFDYIVGIYYQDQDLVSTQDSYLRGFNIYIDNLFGPGFIRNDNDFSYRRVQNFTDTSLFGEFTYHFDDNLRMTFGARYFKNKTTNNTHMTVGVWNSFFMEDDVDLPDDDTGSLFKVNVAYDTSKNQMVYATISQGYRRSGTNAVPLSGPFAELPEWQFFTPDTDTNYEVGYKGRTDSMNYSLSAFYVAWNDIQVNTATSNWGFFAVLNGDKASTKGIEVELDGYFGTDNSWHYGIGYANVTAELDDDLVSHSGFVIAPAGQKLPGTPENTISASLSHTQSLDNGLYWMNRLGFYYQSSTENAINESARFNQTLDGFSILDFASSVSSDHWTATLWIKNIANELGSTGIFKEAYMGTSPAQNYYGNGSKEFMALPRTIGLKVSYEF